MKQLTISGNRLTRQELKNTRGGLVVQQEGGGLDPCNWYSLSDIKCAANGYCETNIRSGRDKKFCIAVSDGQCYELGVGTEKACN